MSLWKLTSKTTIHRYKRQGKYLRLQFSVAACCYTKGYWWHSWRNSHTGSCLVDRFYPLPLETASRHVASRTEEAQPHDQGTGRHDCLWRHEADWQKWVKKKDVVIKCISLVLKIIENRVLYISTNKTNKSFLPWSRPAWAGDSKVAQLCWCREATWGHYLSVKHKEAVSSDQLQQSCNWKTCKYQRRELVVRVVTELTISFKKFSHFRFVTCLPFLVLVLTLLWSSGVFVGSWFGGTNPPTTSSSFSQAIWWTHSTHTSTSQL